MEQQPIGRPRDDNARKAVLAAAFEILQERGYAGLAFELVAKQSGVAKTTIYRWWDNRASLAVETFFHETVAELAFPGTGSAAADFRHQITQLARVLRGPRGQVLAASIVGSRSDSELADAVQTKWIVPRKRWGFERLSRAVAEGECLTGLQVPRALDALYSPLYSRLFFNSGVHSDEEVAKHCDFLFPLIFKSGA